MSKTKPKSPEQLARAEKQRVSRIEGDQALADYERDSVAIRANMERLRALRLAKEADEVRNAKPSAPKKVKGAKSEKSDARTKAQKLAEFLAEQRETGRRT